MHRTLLALSLLLCACEPAPTEGPAGPKGDPGPAGEPGVDGIDGVSCWDLDASLSCDLASEDLDEDGACTVNDCHAGEIDPHFDASVAADLTAGDLAAWNDAAAWGDHGQAGYLTAESDPAFGASAAGGITADDLSTWNTAAGWGDHGQAGYLTAESDPAFTASAAAGIGAGDLARWNAAYDWGDHAEAGYLTEESDPDFAESVAAGITEGAVERWSAAFDWGDHAAEGYLTEESDPDFAASVAAEITEGAVGRWSAAFGWGDHAAEGYLTEESDPDFAASFASGITDEDLRAWDTAATWGDHATAGYLSASETRKHTVCLGTGAGAECGGQVYHLRHSGDPSLDTDQLLTVLDGLARSGQAALVFLEPGVWSLAIDDYVELPPGVVLAGAAQGATRLDVNLLMVSEGATVRDLTLRQVEGTNGDPVYAAGLGCVAVDGEAARVERVRFEQTGDFKGFDYPAIVVNDCALALDQVEADANATKAMLVVGTHEVTIRRSVIRASAVAVQAPANALVVRIMHSEVKGDVTGVAWCFSVHGPTLLDRGHDCQEDG